MQTDAKFLLVLLLPPLSGELDIHQQVRYECAKGIDVGHEKFTSY